MKYTLRGDAVAFRFVPLLSLSPIGQKAFLLTGLLYRHGRPL